MIPVLLQPRIKLFPDMGNLPRGNIHEAYLEIRTHVPQGTNSIIVDQIIPVLEHIKQTLADLAVVQEDIPVLTGGGEALVFLIQQEGAFVIPECAHYSGLPSVDPFPSVDQEIEILQRSAFHGIGVLPLNRGFPNRSSEYFELVVENIEVVLGHSRTSPNVNREHSLHQINSNVDLLGDGLFRPAIPGEIVESVGLFDPRGDRLSEGLYPSPRHGGIHDFPSKFNRVLGGSELDTDQNSLVPK